MRDHLGPTGEELWWIIFIVAACVLIAVIVFAGD